MDSGSQTPMIRSRSKNYREKSKSIVCIWDGRCIVGGGCFIQFSSRQMVLTAAHVVHGRTELSITLIDDNTSYVVETEILQRKTDLALLSIKGDKVPEFVCLKLSDESDNVIAEGLEAHFIGHPGRHAYAYNIGTITSSSLICRNLYNELGYFGIYPKLDQVVRVVHYVTDPFFGISDDVQLLAVKNVHGAGRVGGTGAPLLGINGDIIGLYSFYFHEKDYAIHVSEIKAFLQAFLQALERRKD